MDKVVTLGKPPGQEQAPTTPFEPAERLAIIKQNIGLSYGELAKKCRCSYSTIYNDMRKWREQGGFEEYLYEEFHRLHVVVSNEAPDVAYKVIASLLSKTIAKKVEAGITVDIGPRFTAAMRDTFGLELDEQPKVVEADFNEVGEPTAGIVET